MISQKATILCILEILQKYTDEDHRLSAEKIREKLKQIYGVDMERRTIYRNIDALRSMGIDIQGYADNREGYCLLDRSFEPSEIRLLCDAVAASDMITPDVSKKLINRLAEMLSIFQGRMLQRTLFVKEEKKHANHKLFYNIDTLNIAISQGCKVSMKKLNYDFQRGLSVAKDSPIIFSPYATVWVKGHYYVIGKDEYADALGHYKIELIQDIEILERNTEMQFGGFNPYLYAEAQINQKGEHLCRYDIECDEDLWEEIMETFGDNAGVLTFGYDKLQVKIKCIPSVMKTWVLGHCDKCEVVAPKRFRDEIQSAVMEGYKRYWS